MPVVGVLAAWGRALGLSSATLGPTADAPASLADLPPAVANAFGFAGWTTSETVVSESAAMSVPAVRRARQVITSVMAQMPLQAVRHDPGVDGRPVPLAPEVQVIRRDFLTQPEAPFPRSVTLAWTVHNLIFHGVAWWLITERDFAGFPRRVRHVAPARVSLSGGRVTVDGAPVADEDVIRFDHPSGGLLGAPDVVAAAIDVQRTARTLVKPSAPLMILKDTRTADDEPLTDDERDSLLAAWEAARGRRPVAYLPPGLQAEVPQWNASTIGLTDAREQTAIDVARALNLDPRWLAAPSGDSLTYSTTRESRSELVSITCAPIMLAIAERLSMDDVTPRGQRVRFDTDAVLSGHGRDRIDDAVAAAGAAPMTRDEARARILGLPPALPTETEPEDDPQMAGPDLLTLAAPKGKAAADPAPDPRVVRGLVIPWEQVANSAQGRVRFSAGSVTWGDSIPVLLDHDRGQPAGVVQELESTDEGLRVVMRIDEGPRGDDVLARLASGSRTGLSAGLELTPEVASQMARRRTAAVSATARLREVSFTSVPAFEGARAEAPTTAPASADYDASAVGPAHGLTTLGDDVTTLNLETPGILHLTGPAGGDDEPTEPAAPAPAPSPAPATTPTPLPGEDMRLTVYDRGEAYLVHDLIAAGAHGDREARDRVATLSASALELAVAVRSGYDTDAEGSLVRSGYRGELLIQPIDARRPVVGALTQRVTLTDATPFVIPSVTGLADGMQAHTEGQAHATESALTLGSRTVTPRALSGAWRGSRELLDAANPAIDTIVLTEMRRTYADATEAYAVAQITAGLTAEDVTDIDGLEEAILTFEDGRNLTPVVAMGPALWNEIALTKLDSGEARFPRINPGNRDGVVTNATSMTIQGATVIKAPAVDDREAILMRPEDILWGEGSLLTFRFDQPEGPGIIKLAAWAYQACAVLRTSGVDLVTIPEA